MIFNNVDILTSLKKTFLAAILKFFLGNISVRYVGNIKHVTEPPLERVIDFPVLLPMRKGSQNSLMTNK